MTTTTAPTPPGTARPVAARWTTWTTWLTVWTEGVIAFSVLMVGWRGISGDLYNWVVFGSTSTPGAFSPEAVDYQRLLFGVLGAVTIGWMVLLLAVVRHAFRHGERWAWSAIVASVAIWYVVDSGFSIVMGYGENAVVNTLLVAGILPPLVATRPT